MPRIALFTDTIADVNGVSRFVNALATHAPEHVHTFGCARAGPSRRSNVHIAPPLLARPMPGYAAIDLALPRPGALERLADGFGPRCVHVSTPGPAGLLGRRYALRRGLPLVGTYHTDFPAYVERLFEDPVLTRVCEGVLRWFYAPFDLVIARSAASAPMLRRVGIVDTRTACLPPGMDTDAFHPRHRDTSGAVWQRVPGVRRESVKVLYAGRVSVEKNLPVLARVWPRVRAACSSLGHDPQLVVVGDGPHLPAMRRALDANDACFAGFRHGAELATLYASSDVFVFPSTTDTLGQAVMEAQASGLPAVVTNQGGPGSIVEHGRTGLVLPIASDDVWIEGLVRLITDSGERLRMGEAARARLAPMTIRASVDRFVDLHTEAMKKHKPGRALARGPACR